MNFSAFINAKKRIQTILGDNLYYRLGYSFLVTRPNFSTSIARMNALRDIHQGQRCFIIGNGPSLRNMDLSPLAKEHTFG